MMGTTCACNAHTCADIAAFFLLLETKPMRIHHWLMAASLTLACGPLGCAADTTTESPDDVEEITGGESELVAAKDHFTPSEVSLAWNAGCGIQPPSGNACNSGLEVMFTKRYVDLDVTTRTSVNNTTNLITVKLDTWSRAGAMHAAVMPTPESKDLGTPRNLQFGKEYRARVLDFSGAVIWTGSITAMFAP
jgi:hypothetical protein